jgi:serine/threonine protein kinase
LGRETGFPSIGPAEPLSMAQTERRPEEATSGSFFSFAQVHWDKSRTCLSLPAKDSGFSERFEREARAVASLNHSNICTLHDGGPNYLVMEYIEGTPLQGPMSVDQALKYGAQICDALDAAHRKGITHRDLKPANILATKTGIKLLDFGLAKLGNTETKAGPTPADATLATALTGRNEIVGTLYYMSPEQLQATARDLKSELEWIANGPAERTAPAAAAPRARRLPWIAASVLAAVALGLGIAAYRATQLADAQKTQARLTIRFRRGRKSSAVPPSRATAAPSPTPPSRAPARRNSTCASSMRLRPARCPVPTAPGNRSFRPTGSW